MNTIRHIFTLIAAIALLCGSASAQQPDAAMKKLMNAQWAMQHFYVDSIDANSLVEEAIRAELKKLDPHSAYSTADETRELNEPLNGSFSGIGIQFNMQQDTLYVIQTVAGGPSERVGIIAGDRIVFVNDSTIAGVKMKNTDIQKRLRGPKGSVVEVKVKRRGTPELITFRIRRDDIPLYSIDAAYMLDPKTAYVKISRFAQTTHEEFMEAIDTLRRSDDTDLIIDLCSNGGGYMQPAIEMADQFLSRNDMIVYTEGRTAQQKAQATGRGKLRGGRVVVMVDQYSASASEILSGALQDHDRAVIVGRRTFGKGLVQRPFQFDDGSMIRLTIARYHTPSGRCIQKPYTPGDETEYAMDIVNRYNSGELQNADSIHNNTSLKYFTKRRGRTVYGGGGITPDVFVPIDTAGYTKYYRDLTAHATLVQVAMKYVDNNRNSLKKKYPTVYDFDRDFNVDDALIAEIRASGERDSVPFDSAGYQKSEQVIKLVTKALIARDTYTDRSAYFVVVNHDNNILQQAKAILSDKRRYKDILND